MTLNTFTTCVVFGHMLTLGAVTIGGISFLRARRKTKWPFKESDKLLRSPGESLKRQIMKIDEDYVTEFFGSIVSAAFGYAAVLAISAWLKLAWTLTMTVTVIVLVGAVTVSGWRILRMWKRRTNLYLGWFGERMTAEYLRPLQLAGYRVYHDIPCEPGPHGFNLDHVVVGPAGVTLIETKTRRKMKSVSGHEVVFDGTKLVWPWGPDRHGIQQTKNQAEWLAKWINDRTGLRVEVNKILALPGWYVREVPNAPLRVVNPKILPDVVKGRGDVVLSFHQIDLIARQLDERCRDVED